MVEGASWWNGHHGGMSIMVEGASWWNGHLARFISGATVPTLATDKISFLVVRYGADYPNFGYDTKNNRKSAPNTPYANCVEWATCV
ncbi:hypothetical protein BJP36_24585 [Moorena producens JHB]|uniref:Uncharacterized protein n=1 Tax=Moorena producens (strain JHB) TaxID=1454205 RepID=A0A1D9G4P2_MOOP1|nr:hypothetical protein [Moorena producens]AOY82619.2 hypothetical protein BJP36_24585 [Moorena producens JHB]